MSGGLRMDLPAHKLDDLEADERTRAIREAQRDAAMAPDGVNPKQLAGNKKTPFRYLPRAALIPVAYVMKLGADKYGWWNWLKNRVQEGDYLEAVERHVAALYAGESIDPESGESHWAHIAATALVYLDAELNSMADSDLPYPNAAAQLIRDRKAG